MPRITLDIPPGLFGDDTTYAAAGRWADGSNVRFWQGRPQVIGGWEKIFGEALTGVCRTVFQWTDNDAAQNIAFGTHSALHVWQSGALADITPFKPSLLLTNPFSFVSGSAVVTVKHVAHGVSTGSTVTFSGAAAAAGVTIGGAYSITVIDANTYTIAHSSAATSSDENKGGAVRAIYHIPLSQGATDGTGGAGYGTGAFSTGGYSEPSTADYFPRTWSLAAWGENLLASPRGGNLYRWTNDASARAGEVVNAPDEITHMLVAPTDQVFALGCNEEASGLFNPLCIRHSGVRNLDSWTTASNTTAREYVLPGGGRIVAGRVIGPYLLVWTTHALFLGQFLGSLAQPWKFDRVGVNCGLIGPNAAVVVGQAAFWLGPDLQLRRYGLGGQPEVLACPIQDDMADNFAASQGDKVVASSVSAFNEVRFDYPDARDGVENSRYLSLSLADGAWSRGRLDRTAFVDAGPSQNPIGVDAGSNVYWHERGHSADGGAFSWFIESADQYLDENLTLLALSLWPDIADQEGGVAFSLTSRLTPQGDKRSVGPFAMIAGQQKVDFRLAGRLFRVRFGGNTAPTAARLGKPVIEVATTGRR